MIFVVLKTKAYTCYNKRKELTKSYCKVPPLEALKACIPLSEGYRSSNAAHGQLMKPLLPFELLFMYGNRSGYLP